MSQENAALITELRKLMDEKDDIEERKSALNASIKVIKYKLLEHFEANDIAALRMKNIGTASLIEKTVGKVIDHDLARQSLMELGREDIFKDSFYERELNKLVKEALGRGDALPEGIDYTELKEVRLHRVKRT